MTSPDMKLVNDWMREPDFAERCDLAWLIDWVNRRPLQALAALDANAEEQKYQPAKPSSGRNKTEPHSAMGGASPPSPPDRDAVIEKCVEMVQQLAKEYRDTPADEDNSLDSLAEGEAACEILVGRLRSLRASPAPIQNDNEEAARTKYEHYTDNHPVIHSNRFPTWSELSQTEKDAWPCSPAPRERVEFDAKDVGFTLKQEPPPKEAPTFRDPIAFGSPAPSAGDGE